MSTNNFARMLGIQAKQGVTPTRKRDRGLDLATAKPGFARILKQETPKAVNHSRLAWQVRTRGLVV